MSDYADETNTQDEATAVEDDFAPAGVPLPGADVNEVNPETGPEGDIIRGRHGDADRAQLTADASTGHGVGDPPLTFSVSPTT